MTRKSQKITKSLKSPAIKIIVPTLLGLGVVVWLFAREFSLEGFRSIRWDATAFAGIALALFAVGGRELGLTWRFRALTERQLSWRRAFIVAMLCEFTSSVTPTTAGGGAMSMVFMKREGIPMSRGAVLTISTLFLDEAFFVVMCPLLFLFIPGNQIFGFAPGTVGAGIRVAFWIVYVIICLIAIALFWSIFVRPGAIGTFLASVTRLRPLRRWHRDAVELRSGMVATGIDLRRRPAGWWTQSIAATVMTWVCRYLVVNALFLGFAPEASQGVVFARQGVVWTLLTVSPTPGGSGLSEWLFASYYGDLIADASMVLVIAVIWRLITYYIYLAAGAFVIPAWLRHAPAQRRK